jgi:hypothetical protein
MALKLSSIAADLAKENEGDWVDISEWAGVRLKVRSINSKDYQIARETRVNKMIQSLGRLPLAPEMQPHIAKLAASFLLIGWEGVIVGDGDVPTEYSPAVAMELMTDPAMRPFVEQVIWAATRIGSRDAEFTSAAIKNSAQPSAMT